MSTWALKIILVRCGTHCIKIGYNLVLMEPFNTWNCTRNMGPMLDLRFSGLGGPVKTSTVPPSHKDGVFNNEIQTNICHCKSLKWLPCRWWFLLLCSASLVLKALSVLIWIGKKYGVMKLREIVLKLSEIQLLNIYKESSQCTVCPYGFWGLSSHDKAYQLADSGIWICPVCACLHVFSHVCISVFIM